MAGVLLFAVGLTALLVMITRVGQGVPFAQADNLGLLAVSVLVLGAFVWQENRAAEPIIPLSMFRVQTVTLCCLALFLCFFQLIATSVLMPLRFQMVAGAGPDIAALRLLPFTLATPVGAFVAGKWMTRSGRYKPLMVGGACVVPFAVAALGLLDPHNVWAMTLAMMALGLAIGVQFPTGLVATQNAVPPQNVGLATALTAFSRLLGGGGGGADLGADRPAAAGRAADAGHGRQRSADGPVPCRARQQGGGCAGAAIHGGVRLPPPVLLRGGGVGDLAVDAGAAGGEGAAWQGAGRADRGGLT